MFLKVLNRGFIANAERLSIRSISRRAMTDEGELLLILGEEVVCRTLINRMLALLTVLLIIAGGARRRFTPAGI